MTESLLSLPPLVSFLIMSLQLHSITRQSGIDLTSMLFLLFDVFPTRPTFTFALPLPLLFSSVQFISVQLANQLLSNASQNPRQLLEQHGTDTSEISAVAQRRGVVLGSNNSVDSFHFLANLFHTDQVLNS